MNGEQESIATANTPKDYAGLLWIFLASALGFSLFCATSAIALSDPTLPTPIAIEPRDIANLAFSNMNTVAALTVEAFQEMVATPTASPTSTPTPTLTLMQTASPTSSPTTTRTPFVPSRTPTKEHEEPKSTAILPTATRTPKPTNTALVIVTGTGTVTQPVPPTDTPVPEPTDAPSATPAPPNTATPNASAPTASTQIPDEN